MMYWKITNFSILLLLNISLLSSQNTTERNNDFSDYGNNSKIQSPQSNNDTDSDYGPPPYIECITINEVDEYFICASSGIDLEAISAMVYSFLNGEGPGNFNISLHPSQLDADNKTNPINPFIFLTTTEYDQEIYIRIERKSDTTCFVISSFRLVITTNPQINQVSDWVICNPPSIFTTTVNLHDKTAEILSGLNENDYLVQYFLTPEDASNRINAISNFTSTSDRHQIYYSVTNKSIAECSSTGSFDLLVSAPDVYADEIEICGTAEGFSEIVLQDYKGLFLGPMDASAHQVSYFLTAEDAASGTNPLNSTSFTNNTAFQQTIYVNIEDLNTGCTAIEPFTFYISGIGVNNSVSDWNVCANNGDGSYTFDLSSKIPEILSGLNNTDYTVKFFQNQEEAENSVNQISNNQSVNGSKTIFYRIENSLNPDCFSTGNFELGVTGGVNLVPLDVYSVCSENGLNRSDLDSIVSSLLGNQNSSDYNISYYNSHNDAESANNSLTEDYLISQETFVTPIFIRFENRSDALCYTITNLNITITQAPNISNVEDWAVCSSIQDNYVFDLSQKDSEILSLVDASKYKVDYYITEADAINYENEINGDFTSSGSQILYYRISNNENLDCFSVGNFNLVVRDGFDLSGINDLISCGSDGFAIFNFAHQRELLQDEFGTDSSIKFYLSQNDAQLSQNEIITDLFTNTNINTQQIFVKVENGAGCFSLGSFRVFVTEGPAVSAPTPLYVCSDSSVDSMIIDLSVKNTEIRESTTDQIEIEYFGSLEDAENSSNVFIDSRFATAEESEIVYVRISKSGEDCFSVVPLEVNINRVSAPDIPAEITFCESSAVVLDGGNYDAWEWWLNNDIISTERSITIDAIGDYQLWVTKDFNGNFCKTVAEFKVLASDVLNDFNLEVENADGSFLISISIANHTEFEYSLDGIDFIQHDRFVLNPGRHTVYVRDLQACTTVSKIVFLPRFKNFFSPNNDGNNDKWFIFENSEAPVKHAVIYDRYGKILARMTDLKKGWDGNYKGNPLPADDYWFLAVSAQGEEFTGHFSLIR